MYVLRRDYGVATIGRLFKIIGFFCKRALEKRLYSAKDTYNFKEPTNLRHPMAIQRASNRCQPMSYISTQSHMR